jgi:hypothetical protein
MSLVVAAVVGDFALIASSRKQSFVFNIIENIEKIVLHDISDTNLIFSNNYAIARCNDLSPEFFTLVLDGSFASGFDLSFHTFDHLTKTESKQPLISGEPLFIAVNELKKNELRNGFNYYINNMKINNQKEIIHALKNFYKVCSRLNNSVNAGFHLLLVHKSKSYIFKFIDN